MLQLHPPVKPHHLGVLVSRGRLNGDREIDLVKEALHKGDNCLIE
jgi:hypothetical protein